MSDCYKCSNILSLVSNSSKSRCFHAWQSIWKSTLVNRSQSVSVYRFFAECCELLSLYFDLDLIFHSMLLTAWQSMPDSSTLSMLHLTLVMAIRSLVSCWCFSSCWWGTSSSSLLANTMDSDACGINFQSVLPVIPIQSASRTRYSIRSGLWRIDPFTCIVDSVGFVNRFFTWCLWRFNPWSCLDDGLVLMIPTLLMLHYDAFLLLPANTAIFSSTNATFLSCRLDPYPLLLLLLRSFGSNSLHCRYCCCFLY